MPGHPFSARIPAGLQDNNGAVLSVPAAQAILAAMTGT
jgi:hypothetical protein